MELRRLLPVSVLFAALAATPSSLSGTPAPPQDDPETVAATKGPFSVVLDFTGTFDAPGAIEVEYRPEVYRGELEVVEAATPGPIGKGECLVEFSTEKIDDQISQARIDLEIARTNFRRLTAEAKHKDEASALDLENAEMKYQQAKQTLETYRDVLMPMRIAEAQLSLQSSKDRMAESEEQFAQLQKMYKSDDLVEETEEIVLRREKRSLDQSKARMKFTLRRHDLLLTVDIPRELKGHEFSFRKATNSWELAQATAELRTEKSEFEKAKLALHRQELEFQKLNKDREALTIFASTDGVAVPGRLVKGKWTRLAENTRSLRPGEKFAANQILFTIVQPGPTSVRTAIPEASVLDVKAGQAASCEPAATPGASLPAKITRVARVSGDGNYDAWLEVSAPDSRLIAGNSCKITLTTAEIENAITVPSQAVATDGDQKVVHVWKDGKAEKREVKLGATSKGRTVIESGLDAGEQVLAKAPAGKK